MFVVEDTLWVWERVFAAIYTVAVWLVSDEPNGDALDPLEQRLIERLHDLDR